MIRPIPYRGKEEYIFVSYSHKDSDKVWPIIQRMMDDGYRVWYDDGIDPGTEWDENIASHVSGCGYFIAFFSENYLASNNCKDELNFSRDQGKPQLLIYLEDVELPHGMAMRLGRNQAIFHNRYANENEFFAKLYEAQGIGHFHESNQFLRIEKEPEQTFVKESVTKQKKKILWPIVAAVLLIAVVIIFLCVKGKQGKSGGDEISTEVSQNMKPVTNVLLADNKQLKVTALKTSVDSSYFTLTLSVENKGQADIYLEHSVFYLNGVYCEADAGTLVSAGETYILDLNWDRSEMESHGIDPEAVTLIEGRLSGRYQDNSGELDACQITYYPYGEEYATILTYTPIETDIVVVDTEDYFVAVRGDYHDEETGTWNLKLICVNNSDEEKVFRTVDDCVNNYRMNGGGSQTIRSGRMAYWEADYGEMQWRTTGYDRVLSYSAKIEIYSWDSVGDAPKYPFEYYPEGTEGAAVISKRQVAEEDILLENESIRVAYLGAQQYRNTKADLIYLCNLTDEYQEIQLKLAYGDEQEDNTGYDTKYLEPGQEAIYLAYRSTSVGSTGIPANLWVGICDLEYGNFSFYTDNGIDFTVWDPE